MNRHKLLKRLSRGSVQNTSFSDLTNLIKGLGFRLSRVSGSHHIFVHPDVPSS